MVRMTITTPMIQPTVVFMDKVNWITTTSVNSTWGCVLRSWRRGELAAAARLFVVRLRRVTLQHMWRRCLQSRMTNGESVP
jgi:hypothetical protein